MTTYVPPDEWSVWQLERELAHCPGFVSALAEDTFAIVAMEELANNRWLKIGAPSAGDMGGSGNTAGMIAGLRAKGENYLDFELSMSESMPQKKRVEHVRHLRQILRQLGWHTHTLDQLRAMARADFVERLKNRVQVWRKMSEFEARPPESFEVIRKVIFVKNMSLFAEDDRDWLGELSIEESRAASAEFPTRVLALASTGRVTQSEFSLLFGCL